MFRRILVSLLITLGLLACSSNGGNPTDPFFDPGKEYGGSIPSDATVISNEAFKQLAQQEGFVWDSLAIQAQLAAQKEAQFTADQAAINQLAQQYPAYADLLAPVSPDVQVLPDGNYLLEVQGKSGPFEVVLEGKASQMRSALESKARYETAANQLAVYTSGWEALEETQRTGLPTPQSLANAGFSTIRQARNSLTNRLAELPEVLEDARSLGGPQALATDPNARPPGYPNSPSEEEGAGKGIDHSGNCGFDSHHEHGLYANFWWRQKFYHTSVKSQGRRGSCTAFALTGAVETRYAVENNSWINLSEQFLWGKIAAEWEPRWFGDGAPIMGSAEEFHDSGWKLPMENIWNYNQSWQRQSDMASRTYSNSCLGYNEECSESSHQLKKQCTSAGPYSFCGYAFPAAVGSRFGMTEPSLIYDWIEGDDLPVLEMALALKTGRPMVASLSVVNSFDQPSSEGFNLDQANFGDRGLHAVQVVGFIQQTSIENHPTLPSNVKNWASNSEGGYFIIKNSWGYCWGDAGYTYVPVGWARTYFRSVTIFDSNPSSQFKGAPPNAPPTLSIIAPNGGTDGYEFPFRQTLTFAAQVDDPDSDQMPTVTWTSNKDGTMGTGTSIQFFFTSPGTRVVTATATDGKGAKTSDTITLTGNNLNPTAQIITPLPGATIYANDTSVAFLGKGSDGDGVFPVDLPCSSLAWSSSNAADNPLGTGCSFSKVFASTGSRTISLTATDPYGAKGTATVVLNVTQKPASGPPVVNITSPAQGASFDATDNIRLSYTMSDPGGTPTSTYTVLWKLRVGNGAEKVITPKTCTIANIPFPCFKPSEYGFTNNGVSVSTLSLRVTDPENLSGTDQVTIQIGQVQ